MTRIQRLMAVLLVMAVPLAGAQALAGEGPGKKKGHHKDEPAPESSEPQDEQPAPEPTPSPTGDEEQASSKPKKPKNEDPSDPGVDPEEPPTGEPALVVGAESSELLVQVGDEIHYTVSVGNSGTTALEEVIVLDLVPSEVDVVGVADHPEVEAVQLGSHKGKEDIVWNVGSLAPGQTLELTWLGVAAKAGDLEAVNTVRAEGSQLAAEAEGTSYVGALEEREVRNPTFKPRTKKVVSVSRPRITKVLPAAPIVAGGVLPATGAEPGPWVAIGLALILMGMCALALARIGPARQHVVVLAALALLVTACVSDTPKDSADAPAGSAIDSPDVIAESEDDDDRVLGTRLNKDDEKEKKEDSETEEPAAEVAEPDTVVVLGDPVRTVETVEVTLEDLATEDVDSRDGDNALTYTWDADSTSIVDAASSRVLVKGANVELLTSVFDEDGDIDIVVTLRNLAELKRARVHGHLIHTVYGPDGVIATFESPLIDTVLDPGGETTVTFTYMLPSGSYSAEGSFQAA